MRNRHRQDGRRGSFRGVRSENLTNVSVSKLLSGRGGRVSGEYQVANRPNERQTIKGDNYLIFNICDVNNPLNYNTEPSICMKIWQSDNLNNELVDGLHEEDAKIRLVGVKCSLYQNTPQLTLNGDFSDGQIQLVNSSSAPSRPLHRNRSGFGSADSYNPYTGSHSHNTQSSLGTGPTPLSAQKIAGKRVRVSNSPSSKVEYPEGSRNQRPHKRSKGLRMFTFEMGKKMGITLKPESFEQLGWVKDQLSTLGKGARVVKFNRDSSIVGMVIHEINGDSSVRSMPLREIRRSLKTLTKRSSVSVVFGPSENLNSNFSRLESSSSVNSRSQQSTSPSTPISKKITQPVISQSIPVNVECKLCPDLKKQVESLTKRVELLEGKSTVRKLSKDQLEDLLENAESLTARVRRELSKRTKQPQAECTICMDAKPDQTFIPCGHCVCCEECSSKLTSCPLCRKKITQKVKSFFG